MSRKFRFRLEALLRMKQQIVEQHETVLRRLSNELQRARHEVAELQATMAAESEALKSGNSGLLAGVMHAAAAWEARLSASISRRQVAETNWRDANQKYMTLCNELSAITKLHDRQLASHQQQHARAEQKDLDEVILHKWIQEPRLPSPEQAAHVTRIASDRTE